MLFWKKKKESETEPCGASVGTKRTISHAKSIVNEKLYDTERATEISYTADDRVLFVTKKGNYFSCIARRFDYRSSRGAGHISHRVREIIYEDIRPESAEYAKESIGKYDPGKYIELFGEVEEA